jgi:hypothetical protein
MLQGRSIVAAQKTKIFARARDILHYRRARFMSLIS